MSVGAGSVWVANSGDGTVTRIDPATNKTIATVAVGGSPQAITIAAGRAWVTVDAQTTRGRRPRQRGRHRATRRLYDISSMDPAVAYDTLSRQLLYATCANLLNYPDRAGLAGSQLVPEVAQSLPARSADGKSYTFTIRSGFRFSPPSTERVTAQTFKTTIERTLNPAMKSPIAHEFADIVGASAYMAGKTAHIAGVTAKGTTLTIRLTEPAPNLPARLAQPFFCAVPSNTPPDPQGDGVIPSAGPYRVASNTPGQGVVLTRNPNYHGSRPHRLARIELAVRIPGPRAVAQVQAGTADYAMDGEVDSNNAATLAARYGPHSEAARSGHQQYFVNTESVLDFFALNTHRPLFADARLRQAVSYAINRAALARLGDPFASLPGDPTDHYLPPGIPGHVNGHIYPLTPDLTKARRLAKGHAGATAVLYTCNRPTCIQQAQIVNIDLAAIGLHVVVKTFEDRALAARLGTPGEPFDIYGEGSWAADYPDPQGVLDPLLEESSNGPTLDDPTYRRRLAAAALRTGPERYLGIRPARRGSRPQRRPAGRVRQPIHPRAVLRPHGLPDLRASTASTSPRSASNAPPAERQRRGSPGAAEPNAACTRESSSGRQAPADEECEAALSRGPALLSATRDSEHRCADRLICTGTALATAATRRRSQSPGTSSAVSAGSVAAPAANQSLRPDYCNGRDPTTRPRPPRLAPFRISR